MNFIIGIIISTHHYIFIKNIYALIITDCVNLVIKQVNESKFIVPLKYLIDLKFDTSHLGADTTLTISI